MGFVKAAKSGVVWTFAQQFSVQAINFGVQIVLARLLMPSDFGLIAMITIFVAIGQSLSDSGMSTSLIRNSENSERDYGTVFITNLAISFIVYIIVYLVAPLAARFYDQPVLTELLRLYAVVFLITAFSAVQLAKFSKELKFKIQFTYQLPSTIIGTVTGILLAYQGYGVWSLVWLNIAQNFSFALILWLFHSWKPKFIFDKSLFSGHFNFGYKLTLSSLINTVYLNLYKIIIGKQFSATSVGFFTQADSLRQFPINQLSIVLNKVTFPLFASISNDTKKLRKAYVSAMRLVLSLSAAMMLMLIVIAKPLFLTVFGEKWLPSVPYFQILCVASIFLPIGTYNLNILKVKGRSDLFLKVEIIKKIIGVTSLVIAIPFGIKAMVWSLCITNIFFAYLNGFFSGKFIEYGVLNQLKSSFHVVLLAIIPAMVCYYLQLENFYTWYHSSWLEIILLCTTYVILYLPLIWFFNPELFKDLKTILKR
ncbi:lipopolysaccharide biosynthesis protein [Sphingobacterium suaedae]|uniref:Lipopolysaccharide biosynthesis protein n=1 Tax=Sphingobacterium suaedae TaxID=1686402 RepID=A0ABW5KLR9_9SPHI